MCELVATWCALPFVPKALQRGEQRRAFLSDPTHTHVLHFTPIHGSWLNQVELWFSVLARRFLKRGDFCSPEDFETRLMDSLDVYNTHHAHPYRWTYTGQPLVRATPFSQTRRQQRQGRAWFSPGPNVSNGPSIPPAVQAYYDSTGDELMKWTSSGATAHRLHPVQPGTIACVGARHGSGGWPHAGRTGAAIALWPNRGRGGRGTSAGSGPQC